MPLAVRCVLRLHALRRCAARRIDDGATTSCGARYRSATVMGTKTRLEVKPLCNGLYKPNVFSGFFKSGFDPLIGHIKIPSCINSFLLFLASLIAEINALSGFKSAGHKAGSKFVIIE